jgi:hypothetical protein
MSKAKILRAAGRSHRVIVVLKRQQRGRLASASSVRARASAQARQRRPLIARITRAGGKVTHQYTTLNAFAATISSATQSQLASDPSVATVLPDALVTPAQDAAGFAPNPSPGTNPGNPTTPQSGICPSDPAKPLLESEALQTMHVAYNDPTIPQAANLATGRGVKVAFFADSVDINNPDFTRQDGSHVFIDYRDFTGGGPNEPTNAAEAFGDASSVAAQGRLVYDLSTFVNPLHPLPPGCNIRVRGVAPGASLIGMKVFSAEGSFGSTIIQGLDWAVTHDHADILSESFGGYTMPDTAQDAIKAFNDAAVAAGITVSQGTSDAGATEGITSPGSDPLVLNSAANTNFRAYAQTASYAFQFSNGTWLNDNISSIGGGGFGQDADLTDFVSPGEADWALCTPNPAIYQGCTDFKNNPGLGAPAALEQFGGVSQSAPLTAGTAALVIEAYRSTHNGHSPSPALIKQILSSTANDLGFPAVEQGAGEIDALKAVQAAMSINGGRPTGHSLLVGPNRLTIAEDAGSQDDETFSVTNAGAATQTVSARARALTQQVSDVKQNVTLGTAPTFTDQFGQPRPFVTTTFTIPSGTDRLVAYDAWTGGTSRVGLTLIDPKGTYAAFTRPQGNGNHGQVDVRQPVGGKWTAIVFLRDGTFSGTVHLEFATQRFAGVDSISPSSQTLRPGETGRFHYRTTLPRSPGDSTHDIVISDSAGDQTVLPVVLRSLVPVDRHGGSFDGTLFGGNGRQFVAQTDTFAFDVPKGRQSLSVALAFPDNAGTLLAGWLIGPDGHLAGSQSNSHANAAGQLVLDHGVQAFAIDPKAGRWKFVITVITPTGGTVLSSPYHGVVSFDPPDVKAKGLPDGDRLAAGRPVTATVTVHNTGPTTKEVFVDPRLDGASETDAAGTLSDSTTVTLPGTESPIFVIPTQSDAVLGAAQSTRPIVLEMGYGEVGEGDPDVIGQSQGNSAAAFTSAPELNFGEWFLAPALRGPFDGPTTSTTAQTGMLVHTTAFDRDADSTTGDIWRIAVDGSAPDFTPLTLAPGQTGKITLTFRPQGKRNSKVRGTLYLDDFDEFFFTGNQQIAFPYSYRIK